LVHLSNYKWARGEMDVTSPKELLQEGHKTISSLIITQWEDGIIGSHVETEIAVQKNPIGLLLCRNSMEPHVGGDTRYSCWHGRGGFWESEDGDQVEHGSEN
jgi:hypothetical protein